MTTADALKVRSAMDEIAQLTEEQQDTLLDLLSRRRAERRIRDIRRRGIMPVQRVEEVPPS